MIPITGICFLTSHSRSLRLLNSWCESRVLFNEEATKVRAQFDANRNYAAGKDMCLHIIFSLVDFGHVI
jgi:hypothetical protein